tara:strand:- start:37472 stop:37813 length:342 start_codon:yes stop_codon:yes gene_type:complete
MKLKIVFLLLVILISKNGLSQDNSKVYEQWQSNLYQAYQATQVKNTTEAIRNYKIAIELVNTVLYDHAAFINTMDRVIIDHDIFTEIKSIEEILEDVIKRTEKLYGIEHPFTI